METAMSFDSVLVEYRKKLKEVAADILKLKSYGFETTPDSDKGEMIANLMLTYRHLEDASMRLGKAIQAYEGGVSIYDKPRDRQLGEEVVGA